MKSLKTLIKLQQRELDEMRLRLAQLENRRNSYISQIEALTEELRREFALAGELTDMRGFFGDFSGSIKKKQQRIAANVVKIETQIQELMIDIHKQFSELKKYEIAQQQMQAREMLALKHKEQQQMDAIGIRNALFQNPL